LDLAKYRKIFVEESTEHLAEISTALLELEKEPEHADAIDAIFRMAHSIKGMAASMGYDSITEVAHRLEDRMQVIRDAGRVAGGEELALLFRGLEALESMVGAVRSGGEVPPHDTELVRALADTEPAEPAAGQKKKP
jgi:two-component system chemotaxis sensor kinase CheA